MVTFGASYNIRDRRWAQFKNELTSRSGSLQYDENDDGYQIYFIDGPDIFTCTIHKGVMPASLTSSYSQGENDEDKDDFLTNYLTKANLPNINTVKIKQPATFAVVAANVATANNKSMFSLHNGNGGPSLVKIHEIWIQNTQTSAVTGVIMSLELRRITGHSSGIDLNIGKYDTTESPAQNITAKTNASVSGEAAILLDKWVTTNDEWTTGTLDLEGFSSILSHHFPAWQTDGRVKPIILRDGEGITIKCATSTTVGIFDIVTIFTQEY